MLVPRAPRGSRSWRPARPPRGPRRRAYPEEWGAAAAGGRVVVGTRGGLRSAPLPQPGGIVVLDAHADAYTEERAPTWDATVVLARERARRVRRRRSCSASPARALELLAAAPARDRSRRRRARAAGRRSRCWTRAGRGPEDRSLPARLARGDRGRRGRRRPRAAGRLACSTGPGGPACSPARRCGELRAARTAGARSSSRGRPAPGEAAVLACPACGRPGRSSARPAGATRLRIVRPGVARGGRGARRAHRPRGGRGGRRRPPRAPPCRTPRSSSGPRRCCTGRRRASLVVFLDFDHGAARAPRLRARASRRSRAAGARRPPRRRPPPGRPRSSCRPACPTTRSCGPPARAPRGRSPRRRQPSPGCCGLPPVPRRSPPSPARAPAASLPSLAEGRAARSAGGPGRFLVRAADHGQLADALPGGAAGGLGTCGSRWTRVGSERRGGLGRCPARAYGPAELLSCCSVGPGRPGVGDVPGPVPAAPVPVGGRPAGIARKRRFALTHARQDGDDRRVPAPRDRHRLAGGPGGDPHRAHQPPHRAPEARTRATTTPGAGS